VGLRTFLAGVVLLAVAYTLSTITIPLIEIRPINFFEVPVPVLTTLRPLLPFAMVLYIIGGILVVLGITKNIVAVLFLSSLIVIGVLWIFQVLPSWW